ncbi:hypothetical protein FKW77_005997 [Venturia effusa]|uniref:PAN2-PAN3 deadenylation complex subunit PAN3 n=1 Tax=Venturia effusa TaxID=50376 RepID=A0A517LQC0_9PEZI|nr:hypothetical protein FKW77_005997 [Venturia effusa]
MASALGTSPDSRRNNVVSPRPKGRENSKNTLCRNIGIYGHCRYENEGCAFNHDQHSLKPLSGTMENRRLNVDSPSFKPLATVASNGARGTTISPKAANAAPFTPKHNTPSLSPHSRAATLPRSSGARKAYFDQDSAVPSQDRMQAATLSQAPSGQPSWTASTNFEEFVPHAHPQYEPVINFANDPFSLASTVQGLANTHQPPPMNPYAHDPNALASASFFQNAGTFAQPAQYHNYAPVGPHKENLLQYQRTVHDLFIADNLREDLQRKAEASLQTLPNSTLPASIEHFHSLVPLDTNNQKNNTTFGYVTWLYKATSSKDGKLYTLRRLEGYRLMNEKAITACRAWKHVNNGTVVNCHDAFTTRLFGDSSLIFVTDYHPLSKTIAEAHLQQSPAPRFSGRTAAAVHVPETMLWNYVVQIASALKAIHGNNLAAQTIIPSKVLVTSKNRLRLNGCGILDVVNYDRAVPLQDLQQQDFEQLGRLILSIASNTNATINMDKAFAHLTRSYSPRLKECVTWLLQPQIAEDGSPLLKDIDIFLGHIATDIVSTYDAQLHADDNLTSSLMGELENARLVRLMTKLGFVNERPEFEHNPQWSETGERYYLKLFRDYVFHAVDENEKPVVDLGHVMNCLAKLDAGTSETITLMSRDQQSVFVVSYKELKKGLEGTFQDLVRGQTRR